MTNYRRHYIDGGCYFFTLVLQNRQSDWLLRYVDELRAAFLEVKKRHPFEITAIVILPEHLHCILTLPEGDQDFSLRLRQIKANFSRKLPKTEPISASHLRKKERGIWQRRFWEHVIRDENDLKQYMDYIYFNPVKHGWVKQVVEWEYSSFHRDVALGLYSTVWGGEYKNILKDMGE